MTLDRRCQTKVEEIPIFSRLLEAIINNVMVANYMVHYHVGYFCFMENILYNVFQRAKVLSNENLGKTESLYLGRMTLSLTEKKTHYSLPKPSNEVFDYCFISFPI